MQNVEIILPRLLIISVLERDIAKNIEIAKHIILSERKTGLSRANRERRRWRGRGKSAVAKVRRVRSSINEPIQHLSRATCRYTAQYGPLFPRGRGREHVGAGLAGVQRSQWVHVCAKLPRLPPLFIRRTGGMLAPRYNRGQGSQLGKQNRMVLTNVQCVSMRRTSIFK